MTPEIAVLCPFGIDRGLISHAAQLAGERPIRVLVPQKDAAEAARYGAKRIHTLPSFTDCDPRIWAEYLKKLLFQWKSEIVLVPADVSLRGILPHLAYAMKAGLTADCTDLSLKEGRLFQVRPAFGNSVVAGIVTKSPIQMATVRRGVFLPVERPAEAQYFQEAAPCGASLLSLTESLHAEKSSSLQSAKIIIAGGMGVGSREGFELLENLAHRLGGSLGASRSAVDAGWAPYRCQVGMTGATVCPKLYLAVGIHGAVQHVAGMSASETVLAINSDPKAPIFDYADYGFVGDWKEIIHSIISNLEEFI